MIAQDPSKHPGSIIRINLDGSIPNDNPFKSKNGETNSIWCYGNRNPQGLTFSNDGTLWELEHGPRGGDELNIIERGLNYGWPKITYGINYIGTKISDHTHLEGMEQPIWHWTPSIAVCGMKIYENDKFCLLLKQWHVEDCPVCFFECGTAPRINFPPKKEADARRNLIPN